MPRVLLIDDGDREWMDRASCAGHPHPDWWYPDSGDLYTYETRQAVLICSDCPVRAECYDYGRGERYGIYAGVLMSTGTALKVPTVPLEPPKPRKARTRTTPRKEPVARRHREHAPEPVVEHAPEPVVVVDHVPERAPEPVVAAQHVPEPHVQHGVFEPVLGRLRRLSRFLRV